MKCSLDNNVEKLRSILGKFFTGSPEITAKIFCYTTVFSAKKLLLTRGRQLHQPNQNFSDRSPKALVQCPKRFTEIVHFSQKRFSLEVPRKAWSAVLTTTQKMVCLKPENHSKNLNCSENFF